MKNIVAVLGAALAAISAIYAESAELRAIPSPLLAIDQNRPTVIEGVLAKWGTPLEKSGSDLTRVELR